MNENVVDVLKDREQLRKRHLLSYSQINYINGGECKEDSFEEKCKQLYSLNTFLYVTDKLKEGGVKFTCIKGPLLSYRIYNDATVRICHDFDFLVDKEDIELAVDVLLQNGYQFIEGCFWPSNPVQQKILLNGAKHLELVNYQTRNMVEIHWSLLSKMPMSGKRLEKIVAENIEEIEFQGRKFNVFKKEFELLYLMLHGSAHEWCRLKWLVDILHYPTDGLDFEKFEKHVKDFNSYRIVTQTNYFLKKLFNKQLPRNYDIRLPEYFVSAPEKSMVNGVKVEKPFSDLLKHYRYQWLLFPSLIYKIIVILTKFSRPSDLNNLNSSSMLVYYLYRPISFVRRRMFDRS